MGKGIGWSTRVGKLLGIDVYIHATFWMLLAFIGFANYAVSQTLAAALYGVGFILALFACVLAHEYGHALAARRYGIPTRDITLLPIGGLARLEKMPDDPRQELWVALAGPLVNVVIAAVLFVVLLVSGNLMPLQSLSIAEGPFLERLMVVNLILVGFNLLPAFPMDGGRVLRALLAMHQPYARATATAAMVGQGMALLFGLFGILSGNFILVFIAFFVWIGASQESQGAQTRSVLQGVHVARVMMTEFRAVGPEWPLGRVASEILRGAQQDFPVLDETGSVIGMLTRAAFIEALESKGSEARVMDAMSREFCSLEADQLLEPVLARLSEQECRSAPVMRDGRLIGLFTGENLGEFLMIRGALEKGESRAVVV